MTITTLGAALAVGLLASISGAQTTWYVDVNSTAPGLGTQTSPYASIQYAINQPTTVHGDTLLVAPGEYVENVHTLNKALKLRSVAGPLATTIRASAPGSVVVIGISANGSTFEGFTVTGMIQGSGIQAGIFANFAQISDCIVRDNTAGTGLGVFVNYDANIERCTIVRNARGIASWGFGAALSLSNSILASNTAYDSSLSTDWAWVDYCVGDFDPAFGSTNFAADPGFWNPHADDLHLRPGSACIDAGNPNAPLDPDGTRRDIGALVYDASYAPAPTVYCTAKTNSLGCVPAIGAIGHASASGSPFTIACANELDHKLGLLFYGHAPQRTPYQGGHLCVVSPVKRTPVSDSLGHSGVDDCSGVYTFDFDAHIQSGADPALVAGELVYAQFWSRDPNASFTTNRSDAISFGIAP